ncbi:hypothetical protein R3P38DRAFT_3295053, partial [Favolaschia claudopus]
FGRIPEFGPTLILCPYTTGRCNYASSAHLPCTSTSTPKLCRFRLSTTQPAAVGSSASIQVKHLIHFNSTHTPTLWLYSAPLISFKNTTQGFGIPSSVSLKSPADVISFGNKFVTFKLTTIRYATDFLSSRFDIPTSSRLQRPRINPAPLVHASPEFSPSANQSGGGDRLRNLPLNSELLPLRTHQSRASPSAERRRVGVLQ